MRNGHCRRSIIRLWRLYQDNIEVPNAANGIDVVIAGGLRAQSVCLVKHLAGCNHLDLQWTYPRHFEGAPALELRHRYRIAGFYATVNQTASIQDCKTYHVFG